MWSRVVYVTRSIRAKCKQEILPENGMERVENWLTWRTIERHENCAQTEMWHDFLRPNNKCRMNHSDSDADPFPIRCGIHVSCSTISTFHAMRRRYFVILYGQSAIRQFINANARSAENHASVSPHEIHQLQPDSSRPNDFVCRRFFASFFRSVQSVA